jgi:L-2-hydroxyglutarate oxidase LhgO
MINPVPDPRFPFLGVHFTRRIDGEVLAGPNAVLALAREGYGRFRVRLRDDWSTLTWGGFWRFAGRHWKTGFAEAWRDYVKAAYVKRLQSFVPEIRASDLLPGPCGIRAQALRRDGTLEDDFAIRQDGAITHVVNAPSPAATSSLAIAREIVDRVEGPEGSVRPSPGAPAPR